MAFSHPRESRVSIGFNENPMGFAVPQRPINRSMECLAGLGLQGGEPDSRPSRAEIEIWRAFFDDLPATTITLRIYVRRCHSLSRCACMARRYTGGGGRRETDRYTYPSHAYLRINKRRRQICIGRAGYNRHCCYCCMSIVLITHSSPSSRITVRHSD